MLDPELKLDDLKLLTSLNPSLMAHHCHITKYLCLRIDVLA